MTLLLRTKGACDFDPGHLLDVFGGQRQRFVAVLQGFGPDDWAAPTRCAVWSAHEVVRHLCDNNMRAAAIGPDDRTLDITAGFDPRITPRQLLTASAGEPPGATLSRFVATTEERFALDRARLAQGRRFDVRMPYGLADWTVRVLHGFWIRGCTSATCCSRGAWSTPPTLMQSSTRPRTGCSSRPRWRRCSATRCRRS